MRREGLDRLMRDLKAEQQARRDDRRLISDAELIGGFVAVLVMLGGIAALVAMVVYWARHT